MRDRFFRPRKQNFLMTHSAREEWAVIARKHGDREGTPLFVAEGPGGRETAERWLAEHPQPTEVETAIVADPFDVPFMTVPAKDMEIAYYHPPSCRIVIRESGQEYGRTLVVDEWSRDHLEAWLARNPQSANAEVVILDDGEDPPFPAPYDSETIKFVPPSPELARFLELAKAGATAAVDSRIPGVRHHARNLGVLPGPG